LKQHKLAQLDKVLCEWFTAMCSAGKHMMIEESVLFMMNENNQLTSKIGIV
jgi:hypothetical protein